MLAELTESFAPTRLALHSLAEHVIAPARYRAEGRIGLVPTDGGFGTPSFGDQERVRVEGTELVHERPGTVARVGITTLGNAARFVGVELGAPAGVYTPTTPCEPDAPLAVDAEAARALAAWYAFAGALFDDLRSRFAAFAPTRVTLWPEHFDAAFELGDTAAGTRANFGAAPGDSTIPQPYLYVGPHDEQRRTGLLSRYPFGGAVTYDELRAAGDARGAASEFLHDGAELLFGQP